MDQAITRAAGATQIASPLPAATARRQWSLLLTSANHGVVGPLGSTFTHAGERFERVHVVEVLAAAGAPVDQVNLQVVRTTLPARPVGEFQGYVGGQPSVRWFDRTRMPNVGEKLYAGMAPAVGAGGYTLTEEQIDIVWNLLAGFKYHIGMSQAEWDRELRIAFARAIERQLARAALAPVATQAGQVAVPEGWSVEKYDDPHYGNAVRIHGPCGFATVREGSCDPTESVLYRYFTAPSAPAVAQQAPADWVSVDERLPEGRYCLATYRDRAGKLRIIRAMYARQFEIDAGEDAIDHDNCEYNEADDTYYLKAGWLECIDNWGEYSSVCVTEGEVTHWMPLPALPGAQASTAGERQEGGAA